MLSVTLPRKLKRYDWSGNPVKAGLSWSSNLGRLTLTMVVDPDWG